MPGSWASTVFSPALSTVVMCAALGVWFRDVMFSKKIKNIVNCKVRRLKPHAFISLLFFVFLCFFLIFSVFLCFFMLFFVFFLFCMFQIVLF